MHCNFNFRIALLASKRLKTAKNSGDFTPWTPTGVLPLDPAGDWRLQTPAYLASWHAWCAAPVGWSKPAPLRSAKCIPKLKSCIRPWEGQGDVRGEVGQQGGERQQRDGVM